MDEVDPDEELDVVVLAGAAADELELGVDFVVVVDEPEELEPQAATPRATSTSSAAVQRRGDLVLVVVMDCSFGVRPG